MPNQRLYYLDNLRSFAMLYGVFVHALTLGSFGALEYIATVSGYFRMAAFFLVSGFFAGLVLDRRGAQVFLTQRLQAILVPFVTVVVLLNPITLLLIYSWHNNPPITPSEYGATLWQLLTNPGQFRGPIIWYLHLWFLVTLAAFVVVAPIMAVIIRHPLTQKAVSRLDRLPPLLIPLVLALGLCFFGLASRTVFILFIEPYTGHRWIPRATFNYLPYFSLGLFLYFHRSLWEYAHRVDLVLLVVSAGLVLSANALAPDAAASLAGTIYSVAAQFMLTTALVFSLLWVFRRFLSRTSVIGDLFSRSIYSVYLLHYIIIYSVCWIVAPLGLPQPVFFFTVTFAAIAIGLAVHHFLIERVAFLTFLLNGKLGLAKPQRVRS